MSGFPASGRLRGYVLAALGVLAVGLVTGGPGALAAGATAQAGPVRLVPPSGLSAPGRALPGRPLATQPPATEPPSELPAEAAPVVPPAVEVNPLAEISPDSLGILDPARGGLGLDMWRGTDRAMVENMLPRLPARMRSRTMRDLARRLLLSAAAPPAESLLNAAAKPGSLLALRVERLAAMGEIDSLNRLLAVVPNRHDNEFIARTRLEGLLLVGEHDEACRLARNGIVTFQALSYWHKALILCHLLAGEQDKMMLGVDLLREVSGAEDASFLTVANAALGVEAALPPDAELSPLTWAMLQAVGRPVPAGAVDAAPPGVLAALARAPDVDLEVRARAAENACAMGLVSGEALGAIYSSFSFAPGDLANAISGVETMSGPRGRALLYQAARGQELAATRAEVLRVALQRAERDGLYQAAVPAFLPLLLEVNATPDLSWFATTAGRALYAAGRFEQASAWLMLGRQEAVLNPQAATAVAALWPYSRLAGETSLTTDGSLAAWRAMREGMGDDALGRRQALLRASFQALGEPDPLSWSAIATHVDSAARPAPSAALLYALADASESQRLGETVLLSLVVLGEAGPADSHTVALGAALAALNRVGLDEEARALAIEAALANGV